MLSTALQPDSGAITVGGIDVLKKPIVARQKIGFLSGTTGLYGRLTGRENIAYFGRLHGMQESQIERRIATLADLLELHEFLDRRSENFSTGMKQKTNIARAVVHEPEVVILDEPTTGLDIMAAQTVLDFIRGLKQQGTPVIFSTHHLDEVSDLCDRVAVIDQGITRFDDNLTTFAALSDDSLSGSFLSTINREG
jgi:sodium transport system ATP-binding protein